LFRTFPQNSEKLIPKRKKIAKRSDERKGKEAKKKRNVSVNFFLSVKDFDYTSYRLEKIKQNLRTGEDNSN
jgi:hypothetical protein